MSRFDSGLRYEIFEASKKPLKNYARTWKNIVLKGENGRFSKPFRFGAGDRTSLEPF